jgi:rubrerythrin
MAAFAANPRRETSNTYYASKAKKDGFEQIAALFNRNRQQREGACKKSGSSAA